MTDSLHHSIPYSDLEKRFFSTIVFNRLHNVLQNSTAYLTYPNCRTSRFIHSVGTMHIAGQLLRFSLLNATDTDTSLFLSDIRTWFCTIDPEKGVDRPKDVRECAHRLEADGIHDSHAQLPETDEQFVDDSLFRYLLPCALTAPDAYIFSIVMQALRLVALTHDIGHPPFSHVTERAIDRLYTWCRADDLDRDRRSKGKHGQDDSARSQFEQAVDKVRNGKDRQLHESFGELLFDTLFDEVFLSLAKDERIDREKFRFSIAAVRVLAKGILVSDPSEPGLMNSLHRIVDGDIDADRMDYILRDLTASGKNTDLLQFDRLISSFRMVYRCQRIGTRKGDILYLPDFVPSSRALNDIQEFFHRRFVLFSRVIFHHRVVKTDGLLREVLVDMGKHQLGDDMTTPSNAESTNKPLQSDISGLWAPFSNHNSHALYVMWDDSWLLTMLRKHFFEIEEDQRKSLTYHRLRELLSSRKEYYSLIKRSDNFHEIDEAFLAQAEILPPKNGRANGIKPEWLECLTTEIKDGRFVGRDKKEEIRVKIIQDQLLALRELEVFVMPRFRKRATPMDLRSRSGFFLFQLGILLQKVDLADSERLFPFLEAASDRLKKRYSLDDGIWVYRTIKSGVSADCRVLIEGSIADCRDLRVFSSIHAELSQRAQLFPPFFYYFRPKETEKAETLDLVSMRKELGKLMFEEFYKWTRTLSKPRRANRPKPPATQEEISNGKTRK